MTQPLRWGVLGTGMIAAKFAADLKYTSQGVLVASGSRRQQTAVISEGQKIIFVSHNSKLHFNFFKRTKFMKVLILS